MNIRQAKTADLPELVLLFVALLDYLKEQNQALDYAQDRDKLIGGAMETLRGKMVTRGHVVIVAEEDGKVKGFCAGCLVSLPSFHEHTLIGSCEWAYPMNPPIVRPLMEGFEKWSVYHGAAGVQGYTPAGSLSERVMLRHKMQALFTTYFKSYKE